MRPFRRISEIKSDNCKIFPPRVFNVPAEEYPLEFCCGGGAPKTRMMLLPDRQRVWRYVYLFRYSTGIGQTDRRTDGRTDRFATTISRSACIACWRAIKLLDQNLPKPHRFLKISYSSRTNWRFQCTGRLHEGRLGRCRGPWRHGTSDRQWWETVEPLCSRRAEGWR